jgi:hypothetical protein
MPSFFSHASRISLQFALTLNMLVISSCGGEKTTNSEQLNSDQDSLNLSLAPGISISANADWTAVGRVNGPFEIRASGEASWRGIMERGRLSGRPQRN